MMKLIPNKATYGESSYGNFNNNNYSNYNKEIYSVQQNRRNVEAYRKPSNAYETKWVKFIFFMLDYRTKLKIMA